MGPDPHQEQHMPPQLARIVLLIALAPASAWPQQAVPRTQLADLVDLDLEQLSRVTVTSAARREQPLLEAPASLFVITAEDIRRSGASSLPEVLRMAPNLQVMRGDTSQYVVSARGGLTTTANKMLVLIDGRTVYTPLFSGVFWDHLTDAEPHRVPHGGLVEASGSLKPVFDQLRAIREAHLK